MARTSHQRVKRREKEGKKKGNFAIDYAVATLKGFDAIKKKKKVRGGEKTREKWPAQRNINASNFHEMRSSE